MNPLRSFLILFSVCLFLGSSAQAEVIARDRVCYSDVGAVVLEMVDSGATTVQVASDKFVCVNLHPQYWGYKGCSEVASGFAIFGKSADESRRFVIENWKEVAVYTVDRVELATAVQSLIHAGVPNILIVKEGEMFVLYKKFSPYGKVSC